MHQRTLMPSRNFLSASLSMALGLSLAAGAPVAAASSHDAQADGHAGPVHTLLPTIIDPARRMAPRTHDPQLAADMDYDLSNSPIAHGLASGDLDLQAQRTLLEKLRAEDEPQPEDAMIAATHVVTNCDDSGSGSLRDAINQADSGDIIDMSNLACSVITLDTYLPIMQDSLTLRGKLTSADKYTPSPILQGHDDNSLGLLWHAGEGTLRVEALGLQDGTKYNTDAGLASGGACISSSGNIALVESSVKYCTTKRDGMVEGGAVHAAGNVTLTRSQVLGSKAISVAERSYGGGVYAGGRLNMTDSVLRNNSASAPDNDSYAGGAFARGGGTLRRVDIGNNTADIVGGATINASNDLEADIYIKHALVRGNSSTGVGVSGGMFLSPRASGSVDIYNSTFTNNTTAIDAGAGVRINQGTLTMGSNLISGNWWQPAVDEQYVADFRSQVPVSGTHNLIGYVDGSQDPPADTIRQYDSALADNRPATGSWAFNRGKFIADIMGFVFQPPGCTPVIDPNCIMLPIFEQSIDQSRKDRTVGAGTDIGALESDALLVDGFNNPSRPWAD